MDQIRQIIIEVENLKLEQKFTAAVELLEKSLVDYNGDYRLYEELADIYVYKGEYEKAMNAVDFALELNGESATGYYLKGFILLSKDKIVEAIEYLEKSNSIIGNNVEVLRNLGWAYTMIGQTDKGISILKRALAMAPDDELIAEDLAMALVGIGKIGEGNELLKKIGKSTIV